MLAERAPLRETRRLAGGVGEATVAEPAAPRAPRRPPCPPRTGPRAVRRCRPVRPPRRPPTRSCRPAPRHASAAPMPRAAGCRRRAWRRPRAAAGRGGTPRACSRVARRRRRCRPRARRRRRRDHRVARTSRAGTTPIRHHRVPRSHRGQPGRSSGRLCTGDGDSITNQQVERGRGGRETVVVVGPVEGVDGASAIRERPAWMSGGGTAGVRG